jgi:serine/threonine-protein kinase
LNTAVVEARYTSGQLVYALGDGSLMAVPFDARRKRITGNPVTIAAGLSLTGTGWAQFAVAPNGTVAYIPEEPRSLVFVDRTGVAREVTSERHNFHAPQYSPDGRRLSVDFTSSDGRDVWILSLDQGTLSRATFDRDGHDATWTPDGRFLTYISAKSGPLGIYRARPGNAEPAESLLASPNVSYTGHWLPDGSALVTTATGLRPNSLLDVAIVRNAGRGPIEPLAASQFTEQYVAASPDGRWIAYASNQSGVEQVYLRRLDGDGDVVQVSLAGGNEPVWSRDGRTLFYRGQSSAGQVEMFEAVLRLVSEPSVVSRRALFSTEDFIGTQPHANYDVMPDGRGFVMVRRSPATRIMVIQNLPALVERLRGAPN